MLAGILLTGAWGMLGRSLREALAPCGPVVATARLPGPATLPLDIADLSAVKECVQGVRPDWVVNAAAYTAVDRAEEEQEEAFRVNAGGPANLAAACLRTGARLLHVSTDFVFDGTKGTPYVETDPPSPLGVYARSKAEGERLVQASGVEHVILRVAWLFGPGGHNFVRTVLRLARERGELRIVDDQRGTPTFTRDAAAQARRVLEAGLTGVVHAAGAGVTSWYGFAHEVLSKAGLQARLEPCTTTEFPRPAPRPANSALRNQVLESTIGDTMRPWQDALADYLEEER